MYRRINRRVVGKKIAGSKERKAARLIREAADLLDSRKVIGSDEDENERMYRYSKSEIEELHEALNDYAEELNYEYGPLYTLYLQSLRPEKETSLRDLLTEQHKFTKPVVGGKVKIGGTWEVEIEFDDWYSVGYDWDFNNAPGDVYVSDVYLPFLNGHVRVGAIKEWFSDRYDEDYDYFYEAKYEPADWSDIKYAMKRMEKEYYGEGNV